MELSPMHQRDSENAAAPSQSGASMERESTNVVRPREKGMSTAQRSRCSGSWWQEARGEVVQNRATAEALASR
eukprot:3333969-Pleurochrysis_carterae.AAC.5